MGNPPKGPRVTVRCAVCRAPIQVIPSQAKQRRSCGLDACRRELRRRAGTIASKSRPFKANLSEFKQKTFAHVNAAAAKAALDAKPKRSWWLTEPEDFYETAHQEFRRRLHAVNDVKVVAKDTW